jgi:hypothetical protein
MVRTRNFRHAEITLVGLGDIVEPGPRDPWGGVPGLSGAIEELLEQDAIPEENEWDVPTEVD